MDMIREDQDDEVYRTAQEKYRAIITLIKDAQKPRPADAGCTTSIEKSEILSELLKEGTGPAPGAQRSLSRAGGAYHRSGRRAWRRTIATTCGRGTDIQLGATPTCCWEDW